MSDQDDWNFTDGDEAKAEIRAPHQPPHKLNAANLTHAGPTNENLGAELTVPSAKWLELGVTHSPGT
jgi:hypothetical protein